MYDDFKEEGVGGCSQQEKINLHEEAFLENLPQDHDYSIEDVKSICNVLERAFSNYL